MCVVNLDCVNSKHLAHFKVINAMMDGCGVEDYVCRRLGHARLHIIGKLSKHNLVGGHPKCKYKNHQVCNACLRGKQVKASFIEGGP